MLNFAPENLVMDQQELTPSHAPFANMTEYEKKASEFFENFEREQLFIRIGNSDKNTGWIAYLSIIPTQMSNLLDTLLPFLKNNGLAFKMVRDETTLFNINDGLLGIPLIGKAFTIYFNDLDLACAQLENIIQITNVYSGPIPVSGIRVGKIA